MPIHRIHESKVTGPLDPVPGMSPCLLFKGKKERRVVCCVCKVWGHSKEAGLHISGLFDDEIHYYNGYYYIIPAEQRHKTCKELFQMTPMSYINA